MNTEMENGAKQTSIETKCMKFLRHQECPRCRKSGSDRSGNNLGVWEDHKFCFACGYYESDGITTAVVKAVHENKNKKSHDTTVRLPSDFTYSIPEEPLTWLRKYGITDGEIKGNDIGWTEEYRRLVFPVYDPYGNLLFTQGRKFPNDDQKHAKYHTTGDNLKTYHIIGPKSSSICVVEDPVSAIKVARAAQVMPLWGSNMPLERLKTLSERFSRLLIWLDKDKQEYALRTRLTASPYFDEVRCIITDEDPKCYESSCIAEMLHRV